MPARPEDVRFVPVHLSSDFTKYIDGVRKQKIVSDKKKRLANGRRLVLFLLGPEFSPVAVHRLSSQGVLHWHSQQKPETLFLVWSRRVGFAGGPLPAYSNPRYNHTYNPANNLLFPVKFYRVLHLTSFQNRFSEMRSEMIWSVKCSTMKELSTYCWKNIPTLLKLWFL